MDQRIPFPAEGDPVDLAPFGRLRYYYGSEPRSRSFPDAERQQELYLPSDPDESGCRHLLLWFDEPRDILSIEVDFEPGSIADPGKVAVQYWNKKWPYPHRNLHRGATRGWIGRDDHYRGDWIRAICDVEAGEASARYRFCHLDVTEIGDSGRLDSAEEINPLYRNALMFRLLFPAGSVPRVRSLRAYGRGQWARGQVRIAGVASESTASAFNGWVLNAQPADDDLLVEYLYLPARADDFPHRRTAITVHDPDIPFTFCASDVAERGALFIEDVGVVVRRADDTRTPEQIVESLVGTGTACIYDRVFDEPEQTLERAMAETPRLRAPFQHLPTGRYLPLGCEGSRQIFSLRFNGNVFVDKHSNKSMGRDLVNCFWPGRQVSYNFATGDYPNFRDYENPCEQSWSKDGAPVVTSQWVDRDIEYTQTAFAAYLHEDMGSYFSKRGDEDVVLLVRFEIRNIAHDARRAHLWLQSRPYECFDYSSSVLSAAGRLIQTEELVSDQAACNTAGHDFPHSINWVPQEYDQPLIRCRIDLGKGCGFVSPLSMDREGPAGSSTAFHYTADLAGGERDVITFVIPYVTLMGDEGERVLGSVDYNAKLQEVHDFWAPLVASGAQIDIPDKMIEDFYRYVPVHVAISATKDPGSGDYMLPAATLHYGACGNEAVIQIHQLDYRGLHAQAEKYIDGLLLVQGAYPLDGNFATAEGALAGIAFYDGKPLSAPFSYNTDHGFILWMLSEHYFLTRDRDWLARVADSIIAGCDFVTRERQSTKREDDAKRVPEYGLLPAGHLEDNDEWRYWFAVNAHAHLGIAYAAKALAEIDHPAAERLAAEAAEYRDDILAAVERARVESPVVTLPDNTSLPHLPIRTDIRGPEWGWFREGAYGPMHLVDGGILEPDDERVTWIMKYLEDLVYPTRDLGRPIDLEKRWFSQAGVTIQANLLNNGVAYVRRDEPKHAVRALFNDFAASIYDDVLVFTEHPVVQLSRGVGPYYKTPDECGFLNTLRACMVIEEEDTLFLAKAAPVSWFRPGETVGLRDAATWFGPVSYSVCVGEDTTEATVHPPRRNPPAKLAMRLRRADGRSFADVLVDGAPADWDAERELVWLDPAQEVIRIVARVEQTG